jgi:hypothetical protein
MKLKTERQGHNKGLREVVTRDYTHIAWRHAAVAGDMAFGHGQGGLKHSGPTKNTNNPRWLGELGIPRQEKK